MNERRQLAVFLLAIALLWVPGCVRKKPQLPVQAQAPAETIPATLPPEISEAAPPPPPPEPAQQQPEQEAPKPKPANRRRRRPPASPPVTAQSNASNAPASASPGNPPGSTTMAAARPPGNPAAETPSDTAISADVNSAELTHQKQTTAQLLDQTEKTLSGLSGPLSHAQEELIVQIRSYVAQSRKATTDGDFERAYNLATKAHLLTDALISK